MKIVQYIDSLNVGGAERMAVNISNVLSEQGHQITLIVSRKNGPLLDKLFPSVDIIFLDKNYFFDFRAILFLFRFLKSHKPDIVHAHSTSIYWACLNKIFFKKSYKLIFHDHYGLRTKLPPYKNLVLRLLSFYFDYSIAVSEEIRNWSVNNLMVSSNKIHYIKNFPFISLTPKIVRKEYFQIVCVSNFRPEKNHSLLIEALNILVHVHKICNVKLVLAGFKSDDSYYHNLLSLIDKLNLYHFIELKDNVIDIEGLLSDSDIGVLSSFFEGLPLSLLEYGLASLPVVVTDVGQCGEVVGHGKFGKLVPNSDVNAMSNALVELISNWPSSQSMGLDFKTHVENNYGGLNFIQSYNKLLNI